MGRLCSRLLVLAFLVLSMLAVCDQVIRHITPPTIFERKLTAMERCDLAPVQVGIFGTSRPYQAVDPRALPWPAYSFCDMGQPLELSSQVLQRQMSRMPRLKAVVLGIDEFTFGVDESVLSNIEDYLNHGYEAASATAMTRWRARFPFLRYRRDLLPHLAALAVGHNYYEPTPVEDGDQPTNPQRICLLTRSGFLFTPARGGDVADITGSRRAEARRIGYRSDLRGDNRRALQGFMDTAVKRHLRVILLRTPVHASYRKHADAGMLNDLQEDLASVTRGYSAEDVRILSYWNVDFPDAEFFDVDHLNSAGALHLAHLLSSDIAAFVEAPPVAADPH